MPAERVAMRQAREIIRLKFSANIPTREIARRLGLAPSTVRETLKRFEVSGLGWPLPEGTSESELEAALYANRRGKRGHRRHEEPDWRAVRAELKVKHVTLLIVWDEYIAANPGGYSYSRFCDLYRNWEARLPVTMRQTHAAGERLFVDYAGDGVPVDCATCRLEIVLSVVQEFWHPHFIYAFVSATHFSSISTRMALTIRMRESSLGKTLTLAVRRFNSCWTERSIGFDVRKRLRWCSGRVNTARPS